MKSTYHVLILTYCELWSVAWVLGFIWCSYPKGSALLLIKELLTFLCNIFIPSGVIDSSNLQIHWSSKNTETEHNTRWHDFLLRLISLYLCTCIEHKVRVTVFHRSPHGQFSLTALSQACLFSHPHSIYKVKLHNKALHCLSGRI